MHSDAVIEGRSEERPVVAHSVEKWLPLTMTWVYNQIKYADKFSSIVFTESVENLDQFPWQRVYADGGRNNRFVRRVMRRFGLTPRYVLFDQAIKEYQPHILHSHFGDLGWVNIPLARKNRLKHVVTFYGYDVNMLPTQEPVWRKR